MQNNNLSKTIGQGGKYDLSIFSKESIQTLQENIFFKNKKPYINCLIRNKPIQLKPEEVVRQLMLDKLINEYNYPKNLLRVEYSVSFGREKKLADIVILNQKNTNTPYIIIEVKKIKAKDGKEQLKSYTNATGAPFAVWTNGQEIKYYERLDPNYFEELSDIPKFGETIDDVKQTTFTYLDLMVKDKLENEKTSLKDVILDLEDEVLANAGVDIFEEVFKLIFTKLYDEIMSADDRIQIERDFAKLKRKNPKLSNKEILLKLLEENKDNINGYRKLEFRSYGDAHHTKEVINKLFEKAKKKWPGIFDDNEPLKIADENHLQICVASFQNVKLFNSNLQVIDEAFEYLVNKSAKGEKGQYFTPRNVIDMAVYMINPKPDEYMIDTAAGSCGFTVHTLFNVWNKLKNQGKANFHNFSNQRLTTEQIEYTSKVFGIDFDEKSVRVAKTLNMIAGDGKTNVLHLNSLDFTRWNEKLKDRQWMRKYSEGYYRLLDLAVNRDHPKDFNFDIVLANPPFAGDISEKRILAQYEEILRIEMAKIKSPSLKSKFLNKLNSYQLQLVEKLREDVKKLNKEIEFHSIKEMDEYFKNYVKENYPEISNEILQTFDITKNIKTWEKYKKVSRDVLFIERNLNMLKPGGRMAIVLPQGRFNNTSDNYVRNYVMEKARLIAVVGLDVNTFKPHTGTKTSVLFVQKWNDDPQKGPLNPYKQNYEVFMAVSEKSGKDNSGQEVYKTDPETGERLLDEHGHLILDHDLEEIAKEFEKWAKKQKLSFWI